MKEDNKNTGNQQPEKKDQSAAAEQSSSDRKNEAAVNRTPTATERVKPNAGDGLANEGTIVSYDKER